MVLVRVGFRVGATTVRGRAFDFFWRLLRRRMPAATAAHYWVGTDVMNTIREAAAGTLRRAAVDESQRDLHLADAPWLVAELASIGITAHSAPVPLPGRAPHAVLPLPQDFAVLTYLPASRFDFYGGPTIVETARRLPGVVFHVVGSDRDAAPSSPSNITWHGWVPDMAQRYAAASVVVRIPLHDGLGSTVIEGLLHARHVIYNQELPHVRTVSPATSPALTEAISELRAQHDAGQLALNLEGRTWALAEFDDDKLVDDLARLLRSSP
jgi:Glycosyl transferases group 1